MKCNETLSKWCKNKHGASKIIDTLETYQPTVVVSGWRSCLASASSSSRVQGWYFGRFSSSPSAAVGSMVEAVAAAVVRLVSAAHPGSFSPAVCDSIPRPDLMGVGHLLPRLRLAVQAFFSRRSAPSGLLPDGGAVAVVRRPHRDLAGEPVDPITFDFCFRGPLCTFLGLFCNFLFA
jgi:hypothetical protein